MRLKLFIAGAALCAAGTLHAQSFNTQPCTDKSDDHSFIARFFGGREQACELRSVTVPLVGGRLKVRNQNGGIEVVGEDRSDVTLEARVSVRAGSLSEASSVLREITIDTGGAVEAHGPRNTGLINWSVSYKLHVPHHLTADLHTLNGGISLTSLNGAIHGETTNGGLSLDRLAGDVHLTTTNGGIHAKLDGPSWQGNGLEAVTTNGGVSVSLPSNYSAHLVASTTNGGASLSLPGADQSGVHRHSIDTKLGTGGPTISFETTNGGISIQ